MLLAVHTLTFEQQVISSLVFSALGAVMMFVFGWFLFDKCTQKICFAKELTENKNVAVAIVVGAFLLGIAHIIAAVVGG
jgi:putative membrane protein